MEKVTIATAPPPTDQEDSAYLNFIEGARQFVVTGIGPAMERRARDAMRQFAAETGKDPFTIEHIKAAMDHLPIVMTRHRLHESLQDAMWRGVIETLRRREPELLAEMEAAERSGIGSVEWDPNFEYPAYFLVNDFHRQPGSYQGDPLAGHIYHLGTKVFLLGRNDYDEGQRQIVENLPIPKDGQVRRVLELACSVGQGSAALKRRFPEAEVWAIDAAAPMVRYAHTRAVKMGLPIHFAQRLAEDTKFPDNSFDIVYSHILFHELPDDIIRQTLAEAHRVLRPGGLLLVTDISNRSHSAPTPEELAVVEYLRYWQRDHNGEAYHVSFFNLDLAEEMRRVGFRNVDPDYRYGPHSWQPHLAMPMRYAEK